MSSEHGKAGQLATPPAKAGAALLGALSRLVPESLSPMMESMFAACDDLFFDFASRAKSNQDQNLYFESLREVRLKKARVIADFCAHIGAGFTALETRTAAHPGASTQAAATADSFELIAQEQIEKDVLVTDMVSKARLSSQQALFQLHERMLVIAPRKFEEADNPVDPGRIAAAFVHACEVVDVELKILKLLFKQFDRQVMRNLDDFYLKANQLLIDARVLPNLTPLSRRQAKKYDLPSPGDAKRAPTPAVQGDAAALPGLASGIPETEPEMRELAHLLHRLRAGGMRLPMFPSTPAQEAGPPIARDELVNLLSDVQVHATQQPGEDPRPLDIRQAIDAIIASRGQLSVGQADEDVINVVAMFFDLILDDRNLPLEIQALVSRLQLPILKVALKDRSFFTDRKHPARQLINEIARTSIGWESSSKDAQDALFIRLTELVEEVLRTSADQADVFERCLADLMGFIERNDQRAAKVERRTSEKAQAEARMTKARDMVRHVLHERLEGKELPAAITAFLVEDWQQVLQLVFLKQGKDSPEWIDAVQTVDDLVWSAQPHTDEKSHARRERLLPDLYRRMSAGLGHTQSHEGEAQARIDVIRGIHARLLGPVAEQPLPVAPLSPEQQEKITPAKPAEDKSWREMTAVERQKVQYEALMYEYLKRADEIPMGTWFEYDDLRRAVTRRCKLSTRIDETRMFIFSNRLGVQVYEKPRKAFAYDLQMGHARVIEDAPLFDRTIERISANLRKLAGEE